MNTLKRLRKENGMNQAELAARLGVKQNTVSGWENGVRHPGIQMLIKLAGVFGCTVDELLSDAEDSDESPAGASA